MTCFSPITAYRSKHTNHNDKYPLVFSPKDGQLDTRLEVPCGKCIGCAADQSMLWAIRCYHEASLHERNCFLTLTYEDAPDELSKEDLRNFIKRARHHYRFRYFACGEYGGKTHRPHYHACVFGEDFMAQRDGVAYINEQLYTNNKLCRLWGKGMISIAEFNMSTACYVAGYVTKKAGDPDTFRVGSNRPGIGHDWFDKYRDELSNNGFVVVEGRKLPIPKRYFAWDPDDSLQHVKDERALMFSRMSQEEEMARARALPNKEINRKAALSTRKEKF